jgi:hypothetical protein
MLAILVQVFKKVFKYLRTYLSLILKCLWPKKRNILIKIEKPDETIKYLEIIRNNPNRYKSIILCDNFKANQLNISIEFNNYFHDLFKKEFKLNKNEFINKIFKKQFEMYPINDIKMLNEFIFITGNVYLTKWFGYKKDLIKYTLFAYQKLDYILQKYTIENVLLRPNSLLREDLRQLNKHLKYLFSNKLQLNLALYLLINLKIIEIMLNNLITHLMENKNDLERIEEEIAKESKQERFIELNEYWKFESTRIIIQNVFRKSLGFDLYEVKDISRQNIFITLLNINQVDNDFVNNFYLNDFDGFFFTFLMSLIVNLVKFYVFEFDYEPTGVNQMLKWYQKAIINDSKLNYKLVKRLKYQNK